MENFEVKTNNNQYFLTLNSNKIKKVRTILLSWYDNYGRSFLWRRPHISKYRLIISELLLQRTRAETVANFFEVFISDYPSWKKLSIANVEELENSLKPIGLWKRRASSIHALALVMAKRNGRFPKARSEIEALPGVGQYIANAILLFCHHEVQPLLDVNMARVLERVFGPREMADIRYDQYLQHLAFEIVNCDKSVQVNWAIIDFAAAVCRPRNPQCCSCMLESICYWNQDKQSVQDNHRFN